MYLYYAGQQKVFKDPKKIDQKCYLPKLFYWLQIFLRVIFKDILRAFIKFQSLYEYEI